MIDEWGKGAKYWDKPWNPVVGCRKISEGCENCYAERMAGKFAELQDKDGGFLPHPPKNLKSPPKSGVVFVGNMTNIFGEWNTDEEIVNWLFALSEDAQNLVLTKRTARVASFVVSPTYIHIGMTAENQKRYDERISNFRYLNQNGIPWLSAEPLLGPIDLIGGMMNVFGELDFFDPEALKKLFGWVVVGAESGPNRRPCKLEWVRDIVQQCRENGIPVFVKQLDLNGKLETDIRKFPDDLQIRQVPWKK